MDLTTKYLGLNLKNPLVVSASPLSENLANIKKMEQAGAAAVVMHSLFEEQIEQDSEALDRSLSIGGSAEAASYFPNLDSYRIGPETYLENLAKAKASVKIPIIASLNGASSGGWTGYARKMQEAGADALELNIYTIPTDPRVNAAEIEQRYCDLVQGREGQRADPGGRQAVPVFQRHGEYGVPAGSGRRRRAGALQPLLPARFRPRSAGGRSQPATQHLLRAAAAAALGGDPARHVCGPTWPSRAASTPPTTS